MLNKNKNKKHDKEYLSRFIQETLPMKEMQTLQESYRLDSDFRMEVDQIDQELTKDMTEVVEAEKYLRKKLSLLEEDDFLEALCEKEPIPIVSADKKEETWSKILSFFEEEVDTKPVQIYPTERIAAGSAADGIPETIKTKETFPNGEEIVLHLKPDSAEGKYIIFLEGEDYATKKLVDLKVTYSNGKSSYFKGEELAYGVVSITESQANMISNIQLIRNF